MPHPYVIRQKVDKTGDIRKIRYYGVPKTIQQVSTEELAQLISARSSLSPGDVIAAIIEIASAMKMYLGSGRTVNLKDIGTFFISAGSPGFETPKECTPSQVQVHRLCFKADPKMREDLKDIKFVKA